MKKRQFNEITQQLKNPTHTRQSITHSKRGYKKGDSDDEYASCHKQQSSDEEEGGESQDKFEEDFIDDGRQEEKEARKRIQEKKGHVSSSEEMSFSMDTPKA